MRQKTKDEIRKFIAREVENAIAIENIKRANRNIGERVQAATARIYPLSGSYSSARFGYFETPAGRLEAIKREQAEREERAAADIAGFESLADYRSWLTLEELRKATLAAPKKAPPADPVSSDSPLGYRPR